MNAPANIISQAYVSPTGSPILGTLEHLTGRAEISGIFPTGEPEYEGSTEVFWDDQRSVLRNDKLVYLDEDGREWTFDQLVPASEWKKPGPTAEQLREKYDNKDGLGEHPDHPMSAWHVEVENGNCRAGYWDWVTSQLKQAPEDA